MAFQLHKVSISSSLYGNFSATPTRLPTMSKCRITQNYSGPRLQFSPFSNGGNFDRYSRIEFREAGYTCSFTLSCLKRRDSFLLKNSSCDKVHSCAVPFQSDLRAGFPFLMNYSVPRVYSHLERNAGLNFYSQECVGRRFFSVKPAKTSQVKKNFMKVKDDVTGEKNGVNNTLPKLSDSFRDPAKPFDIQSRSSDKQAALSSQPVKKSGNAVVNNTLPKLSDSFMKRTTPFVAQSSSSDKRVACSSQFVEKIETVPAKLSDSLRKQTKRFVGQTISDKQVATLSQPVKKVPSDATTSFPRKGHAPKLKNAKKDLKMASHTIKSVRKQLDVPKTKKGKKDVKLDSSVSAKVESSVTKSPQAQEKKKQVGNKKEKSLSGSCVPPADAKINGSKEVSHVSKPKMTTNAAQSSQASNVLPAGKAPLSTDYSALTSEKSNWKVGRPAINGKHRKITVHMKPDKPPGKPVVVEVEKRPLEKRLRSLYPPTGKSVMVVESLTKAMVIQRYLGDMFEVLPSYGHVRVLAGRSGSVRLDDDFSMVWEVPSAAWTHLKSIRVALDGAQNLILASDPDREGEAVAWHISEMLHQQDALHDDINVSRVVFHEITEQSIKIALQSPRDIDVNLVHAYLARCALDYLIGFSISPLLWKILPACQSAGRVQSAALALLCDREMEIDKFKPQEYWTIEVEFNKTEPGSSTKLYSFSSHLTHLALKRLERFSICSFEEANAIKQKMTSSSFEVLGYKRSKSLRNPPAPYITSTLQQDAANKLNFPASYTMKLAKKLYEGVKLENDEATGLITYMRTDGLHVSDVVAKDIHSLVTERYGLDFALESTRKYFKKVKNAQEAHEAIRPTNIRRLPSMLTGVLDGDSLKLYALIWSRTMACQMVPTVIDQIRIDIGDDGSFMGLQSTSSRVEFWGWQAVYKDAEAAVTEYNDKEKNTREEAFEVLSTLKKGDALDYGKVELKKHSTQPPSRYSEGLLVKKLEELGIGRPSTYASTIKVLQDRSYVTVESRTLYPKFRGRMVSTFFSHYFAEVADYTFIADMETELDNVSAGMTEWKGLLKDYWTRFKACRDVADSVNIQQVEKLLEETFGELLFASLPNKSRTCPSCLTGTLSFKISRFGADHFICCDHPKCKYIAKTIHGEGEDKDEDGTQILQTVTEPKLLGLHPTSNEKILLKSGPYGVYIQLGEDRKGYLPKRACVSRIKDMESITLDHALDLLQYPLLLGEHPEDGKPVYLKISRFGFSIQHRRTNSPVPKNVSPKSITLEKALKLLLSKDAKQCGRPKGKPKPQQTDEEAHFVP